MLYDTADLDFIAFKGAYLNGTALPLFISDGAGVGLTADFFYHWFFG